MAPVRETLSQAIGAMLKYAPEASVISTFYTFRELFMHPNAKENWQIRHSGLLGIKYVLASRPEPLDLHLSDVLRTVIMGLKDGVDDVVAVAASALVPIAIRKMDPIPTEIIEIIHRLWEILHNTIDDLSSSTSVVVDVLGIFCS